MISNALTILKIKKAESKKFLEENGINVIEKSSENTSVYVSKNNIYVGKIEISDEIKEDSVNAVKMLKKNNIKTG
jgi:cation transport ATPase